MYCLQPSKQNTPGDEMVDERWDGFFYGQTLLATKDDHLPKRKHDSTNKKLSEKKSIKVLPPLVNNDLFHMEYFKEGVLYDSETSACQEESPIISEKLVNKEPFLISPKIAIDLATPLASPSDTSSTTTGTPTDEGYDDYLSITPDAVKSKPSQDNMTNRALTPDECDSLTRQHQKEQYDAVNVSSFTNPLVSLFEYHNSIALYCKDIILAKTDPQTMTSRQAQKLEKTLPQQYREYVETLQKICVV